MDFPLKEGGIINFSYLRASEVPYDVITLFLLGGYVPEMFIY
jgi:hypothetical protein